LNNDAISKGDSALGLRVGLALDEAVFLSLGASGAFLTGGGVEEDPLSGLLLGPSLAAGAAAAAAAGAAAAGEAAVIVVVADLLPRVSGPAILQTVNGRQSS